MTASIGFAVLCFADVSGFVLASRNGFNLFARNVLPVLFPFFFITGLMTEAGLRGRTSTVMLLSYTSGFPTSAKLLSELYQKGEINRVKAIKLATATSTVSPIFVIATVGVGLLGSAWSGVIVFTGMILGALANGILFNIILGKRKQQNISPFNAGKDYAKDVAKIDIGATIANTLQNALQSIFSVGGMIVLFYIITAQLDTVLGLSQVAGAILASIFEMTVGVFVSVPLSTSILVPTAVLTFGGLSVGMQGYLFFRKFGMSFWFYLLYKITHTLFAVTIVWILSSIVL